MSAFLPRARRARGPIGGQCGRVALAPAGAHCLIVDGQRFLHQGSVTPRTLPSASMLARSLQIVSMSEAVGPMSPPVSAAAILGHRVLSAFGAPAVSDRN